MAAFDGANTVYLLSVAETVSSFIIYLSMIHPLICMFSGHLIQSAISN